MVPVPPEAIPVPEAIPAPIPAVVPVPPVAIPGPVAIPAPIPEVVAVHPEAFVPAVVPAALGMAYAEGDDFVPDFGEDPQLA